MSAILLHGTSTSLSFAAVQLARIGRERNDRTFAISRAYSFAAAGAAAASAEEAVSGFNYHGCCCDYYRSPPVQCHKLLLIMQDSCTEECRQQKTAWAFSRVCLRTRKLPPNMRPSGTRGSGWVGGGPVKLMLMNRC